jgi:2-oxoglutarate/2-oxoacid ferredoxin oxidoreductase subunit beta
MAFGVFRQVARPAYEELLMQQVREATQKRGPGDLARLFKSGTTWEVE